MDEANPCSWKASHPYPILESSSIQSLDDEEKGEVTKAKERQKSLLKKKKEEEEEEVQRAIRGMCRSKEAASSADSVGSKRKAIYHTFICDEEEEEEEDQCGKKKRQSQHNMEAVVSSGLHEAAKERESELGQHTSKLELELEVNPDQHQQPPPFHDFL